jgi:hypothetical protein
MAFLKRNLFVLVCLLVGLVSIGLGYMGCSSYTAIQASMKQAADIGDQLANAGKVSGRSGRVAPIDLVVQEHNIKTIQGAVQTVREKALVINAAGVGDYLVPALFPGPTDNQLMVLEFKKKYQAAVEALPELLHAKGPPTSDEIKAMQDKLDAEREDKGGAVQPAAAPAPVRTVTPPRTDRSRTRLEDAFRNTRRGSESSARGGGVGAVPGRSETGGTRVGGETSEARRLADVKRAQEIHCYVSDDPAVTFTVIQGALTPTGVIDPLDMWMAQMTLWVQREVCKALNQVNEDAAKKLREAGEKAPVDVTTLPVKRLIKLTVGDYKRRQAPEGRGAGGAPAPGHRQGAAAHGGGASGLGSLVRQGLGKKETPSARPVEQTTSLQALLTEPSWTGRESGEDLDVVPVALDLVIDQRCLPQVIDRICRANFYVPTQVVSCRKLTPAELGGDYVYGSAPIVEVELTFERYFFPKVYAERMPASVGGMLGHPLPRDAEGPGGGRGGRPGSPARRG